MGGGAGIKLVEKLYILNVYNISYQREIIDNQPGNCPKTNPYGYKNNVHFLLESIQVVLFIMSRRKGEILKC